MVWPSPLKEWNTSGGRRAGSGSGVFHGQRRRPAHHDLGAGLDHDPDRRRKDLGTTVAELAANGHDPSLYAASQKFLRRVSLGTQLPAAGRMTVAPLRYASTVGEVREAMSEYSRGAAGHPLRARKLFRSTTYWVYDPSTGLFGPSKFIAFSDMDFPRYEVATKGETAGATFDGGATRRHLAQLVCDEYREVLEFHEALLLWAERLGGAGILDGVDNSKWRFLQLEGADSGHAAPPAPPEFLERRLTVLREVTERPGQGAFRKALLKDYGGRCALTGADHPAALQAAHIKAVKDGGSDDLSNGLPLRADVHILFDAMLLSFDEETGVVVLSEELADTELGAELAGLTLRAPDDPTAAPAQARLRAHREEAGLGRRVNADKKSDSGEA